MKNNELVFETRALFRKWLESEGATSDGVWLVFAKTDTLKTLSALEALEEALCFGWIDGQMQSIDEPASVNFSTMSDSVQRTYTLFYFDAKSDKTRRTRLEKIIDRLNKNLKPM